MTYEAGILPQTTLHHRSLELFNSEACVSVKEIHICYRWPTLGFLAMGWCPKDHFGDCFVLSPEAMSHELESA